MDTTENKFNLSNYKYVMFRMNSPYKWGKGWLCTAEEKQEFDKLCIELMSKIGLIRLKKFDSSAAERGVNEIGEYLFFHPMEFTGTLLENRILEVEQVIKEFKFPNFSWNCTDIYEIKENDSSNPNTIYRDKFLKLS